MPPVVLTVIGFLWIVLGLFAYYVRIKRNFFWGYRTARAMASEEAWVCANRTFGKFLGIAGAVNVLLGVGGTLTVYAQQNHPAIYGINFLVFIVGTILSIYLTERCLFQKYDK
ncbi:SdpI family protein [Sporomusa termitida]|uniref:SdpI/YhfL protein family protein n=1 Tax=Sporomusa termitida TaxID=2377 RepID=A0A517DZB1_9FIRM|nr:SdpI family protein [Sporomusa termitida]QDR82689.1 SdpI/YhfL protein family protein [Sporomusa termitida]